LINLSDLPYSSLAKEQQVIDWLA